MQELIEYIPILTTLFSIFFLVVIGKHYLEKRKSYLFWWSFGVLTFGLGTLSESINAIFGWSELNLRFWYVVGALLGGFPQAQGSVHLLMNRKFAQFSGLLVTAVVVLASVFVFMTPIALGPEFDGRLTGKVFEWEWVRYFSPWINIYAFIFLFGGAIYSAWLYREKPEHRSRYSGNILIAIGALLPGIGGSATRFGYVEVLFITELIGLIMIYWGYSVIKADRSASIHLSQKTT